MISIVPKCNRNEGIILNSVLFGLNKALEELHFSVLLFWLMCTMVDIYCWVLLIRLIMFLVISFDSWIFVTTFTTKSIHFSQNSETFCIHVYVYHNPQGINFSVFQNFHHDMILMESVNSFKDVIPIEMPLSFSCGSFVNISPNSLNTLHSSAFYLLNTLHSSTLYSSWFAFSLASIKGQFSLVPSQYVLGLVHTHPSIFGGNRFK